MSCHWTTPQRGSARIVLRGPPGRLSGCRPTVKLRFHPALCNDSCTLVARRARQLRKSRRSLALVLAIGVLGVFPSTSGAASACPGAGARPTTATAAAAAGATLCLINQIRVAHHLRPLRANPALAEVATSQVRVMVSWDYFADDRPTGQTPLSLIDASRYLTPGVRLTVGQNIAWGSGSFSPPRHVVREWMASPAHRAVILTASYTDAGVAIRPALPRVLRAGSRGSTYAMEFAGRR